MKRTSARKGFTLIELIVTIVILGILAALAVPAFQAVIERARQNAVEQAGNSIAREAHALAAFDQNATVADTVTVAGGTDDAATDVDESDGVLDELEADFPDNVTVVAVSGNSTPVTDGTATEFLVTQGEYEVVVNLAVAAGNHDADAVTAQAAGTY